MKTYFKIGILAQSTIEFTIGFVMAILFLYLTSNLFVYLNHSMIARQQAYENTRVEAASSPTRSDGFHGNPGRLNFYTTFNRMDPTVLGGYR
jgi:hypothetical protein